MFSFPLSLSLSLSKMSILLDGSVRRWIDGWIRVSVVWCGVV